MSRRGLGDLAMLTFLGDNMDFSTVGSSLETALGVQLPRILGALAILIIGWILAVVVRGGVRRLLGMTRLNARIAETTEQTLDLESGFASGAFWLIILVTLIGVFNSLDLVLASGPFEVLVRQIAGAWNGAMSLRGASTSTCMADRNCGTMPPVR